MILQKNNKYAKKITAGLGALIVSLGIFTGCGSVNNKVNYIGNIEVCDEQTVNNYLDGLDIKDRYKKIPLNYVGTLVAKDKDGRYCIIQTLEEPDYDNNIVKIYDIFTESYLCQISLEDGDNKIRNK